MRFSFFVSPSLAIAIVLDWGIPGHCGAFFGCLRGGGGAIASCPTLRFFWSGTFWDIWDIFRAASARNGGGVCHGFGFVWKRGTLGEGGRRSPRSHGGTEVGAGMGHRNGETARLIWLRKSAALQVGR